MERARTPQANAKASQFILSQTFNIGGLAIRYYSLLMASAILVGYFIGQRQAKIQNLSLEIFDSVSFWVILVGFVCARIYYVLFYPEFYRGNWTEVFKIWHGGIAIYGAIIGGMLAVLFLARKYKISALKITDVLAFGLPLAQAIGRFGNYFNYEAFGLPAHGFLKMYVPPQFRPARYFAVDYFQPTFLYEAIWNVAVFIILLIVQKKVKNPKPGLFTAVYLIAYSIGRYFIEGIRLDSAFFGPFRGDQLTALVLIALSLGILYKAYATQNN